ncbi:YihY/virulence factor BrkB family protein [Halospeciosus flavus]|uniref:YihY/virulence factor BrkB family protein n=1 Tax=Halospeciosus flavus TaxID=3032283 RepID=A0ABD5Z8V9_9EURY|nr:YhjD/YihY/BrkB family envelope integrity protein [Halospeciosus flavus]
MGEESSAVTDFQRTVRAVVAEAREQRMTLVAAGLAYYLFLLLVPLSLLALIVLEEAGELSHVVPILHSIAETKVTVGTLHQITGGDQPRERAAVIASVLLIWSATRTFQALNRVFADVLETNADERVVQEILEVVVVLVLTIGSIGFVAAGGVLLARATDAASWYASAPVLLFVGFVLLFFPIYYVFPATDVTVGEVLPGTLFAAGAWTLSGLGFRLYAEASRSVHLYGVVGAVLLLMTWLYVGGLVLLVGVVLNAVLGGHVVPEE